MKTIATLVVLFIATPALAGNNCGQTVQLNNGASTVFFQQQTPFFLLQQQTFPVSSFSTFSFQQQPVFFSGLQSRVDINVRERRGFFGRRRGPSTRISIR